MHAKLFTIDEVAAYLGVHRDTVYNMIRSGKLPAMQLGGRKTGWRIREDDLQAFMDAGRTGGPNGSSETEEQAMERFNDRQREELDEFQQAQRDQRQEFLSRQARDRDGASDFSVT